MAQTPEGKVKSWLYGRPGKRGVLYDVFPDAYVYKPPGGMFGQAGAVDCFLLWSGVFVALEVKSDTGTLSDLQLKRLQHVIRQGGVGAVIYGRDMEKLLAIKAEVLKRVA